MSKKSTQPKPATPKSKARDLKPAKDAKGGIGLLLPAVQKVRDNG